MEAGTPQEVSGLQEQNKSKLDAVKDIMIKNKQSLKKKEEELEVITIFFIG